MVHLGKREGFYIHLLVMMAWGPPKPSPDHEVNHSDGNKLNNDYRNLEWSTRLENEQHARTTGLTNQNGSMSVNAKLIETQVLEIRERYANGDRIASLAREFGVVHATIGKIVRRERWRHI